MTLNQSDRDIIKELIDLAVDMGPDVLGLSCTQEELALLSRKMLDEYPTCPYCGGEMVDAKTGENFVTLQCLECQSKVSVQGYPKEKK